jgi:hypothetical protein
MKTTILKRLRKEAKKNVKLVPISGNIYDPQPQFCVRIRYKNKKYYLSKEMKWTRDCFDRFDFFEIGAAVFLNEGRRLYILEYIEDLRDERRNEENKKIRKNIIKKLTSL